MHRLVASAGPAGALLYAQSVIGPSDKDPASGQLLEMALHAKIGVTHSEHLCIDRAVSGMADGATLTRRFVLEHVGATLCGMTPEATFVFGKQGGAAAEKRRPLVGRMAIGAGQLSLRHRMMARQAELAAHVCVTLEADSLDLARRLDG
jgi:hypothetical protein